MAIEIISRGILPEEEKYSFNCITCNTKFTAQKSDGSMFNDRDNSGLKVSCPVCSTSCYSSNKLG